MLTISMADAIEQLARAVEAATADDVVAYFAELYPASPIPDVDGATQAEKLAEKMAQHLRSGIEPEVVVDLWNVVYPTRRCVSYDDEDLTMQLRNRDMRLAVD